MFPLDDGENSDGDASQPEKTNNLKRAASAGDDENASRKRRNRAVLSCRPCKARKIKCDRRQPCESCTRRGIPQDCAWDDSSKILDSQPFASTIDLEDIRYRLELVENVISRLPPNILLSIGSTTAAVLAQSGAVNGKSQTNDSGANHTKGGESDEGEGEGEEAAVGALEELALGHRLRVKNNNTTLEFAGASQLPIALGHLYTSGTPNKKGDTPVTSNGSFSTHNPAVAAAEQRTHSTIFLSKPAGGTDIPPTDFLAQQHPSNLIRQALKALPRQLITDKLLDYYFDECSWTNRSYYKPYFDAEYQAFWAHMYIGGQPELVDPAWLALVFAQCALAARAMPANFLDGESEAIVRALPEQFFKASQICLDAACWTARPQFRVLQTLCLYGPFVWFTASRNEGIVWLSSAIRISQLLGIHRLGNDQETMPEWEDLAFPTGPSSLKRQLCARVWYNLMFLDAMYTSSKDHATFFPVPGATTALPMNCNDSELLTSKVILDKPRFVLTDMTYDLFRWAIADIWRFAENGIIKSYDAILKQDDQIRKVVATLPPELMVTEAGDQKSNSLIWKRSIILSGLYAQVVRLHRPFYYRSFKNSKFSSSRMACVSASIAIIQHNNILSAVSRQERYWYMFVHVFSAVICLLLDLLHLVDSNDADKDKVIAERIGQMEQAKNVFLSAKETTRLGPSKRICQIGQTLINATVAATRDRQNRAVTGLEKQETFTASFARIAAEVQASVENPQPQTDASMSHFVDAPNLAFHNYANPPSGVTDPYQPIDQPATADMLRSLGLSLDQIILPSPPTSSTSTSVNTSLAYEYVQPESVFDTIFKESDFKQLWWNS